MQTTYYRVDNIDIMLELPEVIDINQLQIHIPGIQINETYIFSNKNTIFLSFVNHRMTNITKIAKNEFHLHGIWDNNIKNDIPHLLYGILRQYWIENEKYPIHSICIDNNLLLGHSGSGKTGLGILALMNKMNVSSFNKTLVYFQNDNLKVLIGTEIISIMDKMYMEELSILKEDENITIIKNEIGSVLVVPPILNSIIINKMCFFFLSEKELEIKKLNKESGLHELYPYFMDTMKSDVILGNGQCIYSGDNSEYSKQNVIKNIKKWLIKNKDVEILIGNPESIIKYLKKLS